MRVLTIFRRAALCVACLLPPTFVAAQGGPPLLTDDPGTPGDGRFEVNLAITTEGDGDGRSWEAPLLDFNYGLGENVQLKYEVPWVFVDEHDDDARNGLGNSLVGVKWRFLDARGREPSMSIYPQVGFVNPGSSSGDRGIAEPGTSLLLPLQIEWDLGDGDVGGIGLGVEVGRQFSDVGDDGWIAGVAVSRFLDERFELLAEVHGEAEAGLDASQGVFNVGARAELAPGHVLLAAVGTGLWSDDSERPDATAYVGIQLQF